MTNLVRRLCLAGGLLALVLSLTAVSVERAKAGAKKEEGPAAGAEAAAEPTPGERPSNVVRLRKFTGLAERGYIKTPNFRAGVSPTTAPQDWAEITLTFDVFPDWINELMMRFYVMTSKEGEKGKMYSLYKTTVTYRDIERGRGRVCSVYLTPTALKRHGKVVAIGVEVLRGGKIIDEMSETDVPMPAGEKWWRNEKVVDSKIVVPRDGYLLNRDQSPFRLINIDDYPFIRQ
ncbi:MAG: hypothetical protein QME60_00110 [Verrucomicrobiota bacterium]|nr:hypothetical protein [Verrucomicrobiota bacterium]